MFGILPRIKQLLTAPIRKWNIVGSIENEFERITVSSKVAVAEPFHCCSVLCLDPSQCLRAFGLFEPKVRVIVRRFDSGSYINDRHSRLLEFCLGGRQ